MMKLHLENLQEINDELELKNKDYKIRIKLLLDKVAKLTKSLTKNKRDKEIESLGFANLKELIKSYEKRSEKISELENDLKLEKLKNENEIKEKEDKLNEKINNLNKKIKKYKEILRIANGVSNNDIENLKNAHNSSSLNINNSNIANGIRSCNKQNGQDKEKQENNSKEKDKTNSRDHSPVLFNNSNFKSHSLSKMINLLRQRQNSKKSKELKEKTHSELFTQMLKKNINNVK